MTSKKLLFVFFIAAAFDFPSLGFAKELTPEAFGCAGNGSRSDSSCFAKMLDSAKDGDVIKLRSGAVYYNDLSAGRWIIKSRVRVEGNGAVLRKSAATRDMAQIAVLEIYHASGIVIDSIELDGGDPMAIPVNRLGVLQSVKKYSRSLSIDYGLLIKGGSDVTVRNLIAHNSLFNVWAVGVKNFSFTGNLYNSGQLFPVTGKDLQYGAGIKLSNVKGFSLDVKGHTNTNALVELEPDNEDGSVKCVSSGSLSSGLTVYRSSNIAIDAVVKNSERVGAQLVQGASKLRGTILAINNAAEGVVISNTGSNKAHSIDGIDMEIESRGNGKKGLMVMRGKENASIKGLAIKYKTPDSASAVEFSGVQSGNFDDLSGRASVKEFDSGISKKKSSVN